MACSLDAGQPTDVRGAHFAQMVALAFGTTKPMGQSFARVADKVPGYSAKFGWIPVGMEYIADLEMNRAGGMFSVGEVELWPSRGRVAGTTP
jgi:hypothetical protein